MSSHKFMAATAIAAFGIFATLAATPSSEASQMNSCRSSSKQKAVACCQREIRSGNKWLLQGGNSCQSQVVCITAASTAITHVAVGKRYCYVKWQKRALEQNNDGGRKSSGFNNSNNNNQQQF